MAVFLPRLATAADPRQVHEAVAHYTAAGIEEGCAIESILFATWFNRQSFGGTARVVEFEARDTKGRFGHTATVYAVEHEFYSWDVLTGGGDLGISEEDHPNDAELVRALARQFDERYLEYWRHGESSKIAKAPHLPTETPAQVAFRALAQATHAKLLDVDAPGGRVEVVACLYRESIYVFLPSQGTLSGHFRAKPTTADFSAAIDACLHRLFHKAVRYAVVRES